MRENEGKLREKEMDSCGGREALVVCSDRSMSVGITVWDMVCGDQLLHIPTCAASPRGLLCLREQFLVASQIHRHGSIGGGAIFVWPLNKVVNSCLFSVVSIIFVFWVFGDWY